MRKTNRLKNFLIIALSRGVDVVWNRQCMRDIDIVQETVGMDKKLKRTLFEGTTPLGIYIVMNSAPLKELFD